MTVNSPMNSPEKGWTRQEARVVRPFRSADEYLKDTAFRLYEDSEYSTSEMLHETIIEIARLLPSVRVLTPPSNLVELVGASTSELRLLISFEDRVFKNTVVAANIPLFSVSGGLVELDQNAVSEISWAGETRIHVSVVLAENREADIGTAYRAGSWVARKTFTVSASRETASFRINSVEPEYFINRGLPGATTYLIEILDPDLNQPCENLPELVRVSLSKKVHEALAKDEESFLAKALIKGIYVDVVTTVLSTGYSISGLRVEPNSILDVVTTKLSKATGVPVDKLQKLAEKNSGAELRAVVQAEAEFTRALISAAYRRAA